MKKLMLVGKTGSGKTSFSQALGKQKLEYRKTQDIRFSDEIIDTPGEYLENRAFYKALMVTACEADIIIFFQDATDESCVFPEAFSSMFALPVYGLITKIDLADHSLLQNAYAKLRAAGCGDIFKVSSMTGEGIESFKAKITGNEESWRRKERNHEDQRDVR